MCSGFLSLHLHTSAIMGSVSISGKLCPFVNGFLACICCRGKCHVGPAVVNVTASLFVVLAVVGCIILIGWTLDNWFSVPTEASGSSLILHNEPTEPTAELLLNQKHHLHLITKVLDAPRDSDKNSLKCRSPSIPTHAHTNGLKEKHTGKKGRSLPAVRKVRLSVCSAGFSFSYKLICHSANPPLH